MILKVLKSFAFTLQVYESWVGRVIAPFSIIRNVQGTVYRLSDHQAAACGLQLPLSSYKSKVLVHVLF